MRLIVCLFLFLPLFSAQAKETYARLVTNQGTIKIRLLTKQAPRTVENFVKLSKGEQRFVDTEGKKALRPFYNGLIFHRVSPELGIFSGCQWGTGRGWPGYYVFDENSESSIFDQPGKVAMAKLSSKDNRFGSQFFITTAPATHLNKKVHDFRRSGCWHGCCAKNCETSDRFNDEAKDPCHSQHC
jgi:peptidyl-prolyl cis-trans isomerase A (cyclophilin A)